MTNNEIFFNLYNTLDDLLKEKYHLDNNYNISSIQKRINELKASPLIKNQNRGERLDIMRNLRNSLAHVERYDNVDNFIITSACINALKEEINDLKHPITAYQLCKNINEVKVIHLNDSILEASKVMIEKGFTHLPLLNDGKLIGIFSQSTLFTYFVKAKTIPSLKNATFNLIKDYLTIESHENEGFYFVKKNEIIENLLPYFQKKINNKRTVMLLVTENGKKEERILGILTSYDLLK